MTTGQSVLDTSTLFIPDPNGATPAFIKGGSAPAEQFEFYSFPDGGTEPTYIDFSGRLSETYAGGGVNLKWRWGASVNINDVWWEAAFRRDEELVTDFTAAHTYVYQSGVSTAPPTIGTKREVVIAFSNGAQMDNLLKGEPFVVRIRRRGEDAVTDTMVGIAEHWWHTMGLDEQ